ncbi:DUF1450 domain-containing protein [Laceyella putida]|uniref:DUF1450 domain-containing protein n=1 Tax=Laceyella putida TaxID=110101 RepID=A0ABW2RFG1_9BACL
MIPLVEFCINNLTPDVLEIKNKLEQDPGIDVLEYGCLGNCGICAQGPYAMVNGEVITANSGEELLQKIYQAMDEMEVRY